MSTSIWRGALNDSAYLNHPGCFTKGANNSAKRAGSISDLLRLPAMFEQDGCWNTLACLQGHANHNEHVCACAPNAVPMQCVALRSCNGHVHDVPRCIVGGVSGCGVHCGWCEWMWCALWVVCVNVVGKHRLST
eukprot:6594715-Alexandrium_andersonii.AAC.1